MFSRFAQRALRGSAAAAAMAALLTGLSAQEPAAGVAPAVTPQRVQVGAWTLESRGPWTAQDRLTARPPELWVTYMHGVVDFFARPVPWEDLLAESQPAETWLDPSAVVANNPFRNSPMPALRLQAGQEIVSGKPLVNAEQLAEHAGKTLRIFVWMCAKDSGQGQYLWNAAPRLDVLLTHTSGALLSSFTGPMASRGTFPWHCYYRDVPIPPAQARLVEEAASVLPDGLTRARGLYVRAVNPASGTAWFSTLSWEVVDASTALAPADRQDPRTGSLAPNPAVDELPVHLASGKVLHRGLEPAAPWAFLQGPQGGAGRVPDLLSAEGLKAYIEGVARHDPHHLLQGVARLPEWYHSGAAFGCLPPHPERWIEDLGRQMLAAQDSETGLWGYAQAPRSMAATAVIVERMFGGWSFRRADRASDPQPWLSCGEVALPNPESIARTVLSQQSAAAGSRGKGAWSIIAGHYATPLQLSADTSCSLAATADAVFLLRRVGEKVSGALRARCDRAVQEGLEQAWRACVLPSGLWLQTSLDAGPSTGGILARLLEASPWLEFRTNPQIGLPGVPDQITAGKASFTVPWREPTPDAIAVRLYIAPAGTAGTALGDQYLAGVIQASDGDVRTMDPLLAALTLRRVARARWGQAGFEDFPYTAWKLGLIREDLPVSLEGAPLELPLPKDPGAAIFACAVNAAGETSRPLPISLVRPQGAPAAAPEAAPAAPAAPSAAPAAEEPPPAW